MELRYVAFAMLTFAPVSVTLLLPKPVGESQYGHHDFVASHASTLHGMSLDQQQQTILNLQRVIEAEEDFATLVFFGDSTMSGVTTEILNLNEEVTSNMELIYVSNDRKRRVRYGCDEACGGVPPGGEWMNQSLFNAPTQDFIYKETFARALASTKALHDKGCKSGGGLETYVFRGGPYKNLVVHHWGFLPEYSQFCWQSCMNDAMKALKPTAVLWNIGFHLLNHDFTPSICKQRNNPASPGCADHKEMVKMATMGMLDAGVKQVVFKHTNWVCEKKQIESFPVTARGLKKWHETGALGELEKQCEEDCPAFKGAGLKCYDWFFDAHTSERLYNEAEQALNEMRQKSPDSAGRILSLDAYTVTKECCDRGCDEETDDGEHYAGLDGGLALEFTSLLGSMHA